MTLENITIRDSQSGAFAEIIPAWGFNCHKFLAPRQGRMIDVLWSHPNLFSGRERPTGSGIPLLFPYPGRIAGREFHWQGKSYEQEAFDAHGNAIHGFVLRRPWRVIERTASRLVGEFHAWRDDPALKTRWPADFRITAAYEVEGATLRTSYLIENPGDEPLPCGLGTHAYFRLPLSGTNKDTCIVKLPVTKRWELENMLPTGRCLPVENAAELQAGKPFGSLQFDDVFGGLQFVEGDCSASIIDPESSATMTISFGPSFRECVVYTPPHREAICIEPYTCVPGASDLHQRGIAAGLRVLPPGAAFASVVEMTVR